MIERDMLHQITPFLDRKEFIAIVGPRQAGKTTFLSLLQKYLLQEQGIRKGNIHMVTFEDRMILDQFETDPAAFVRSYVTPTGNQTTWLMLDEFQYARDGGQKLKLVYDTVDNVKIIVTGSSSLEIKAQMGKYMVGRVLTFTMYPFNFGEYLRAESPRLAQVYYDGSSIISAWLQGKTPGVVRDGVDQFHKETLKQYEHYCVWGGYPALSSAKTVNERFVVLSNIYNSYVLKDVKGLLELSTDNNLFLLSQFIATQTGNIVVYNNLAQAARLDIRQLKIHLNVLKETFVCTALTPYFTNKQKELVKNPKMYFYDMGFRNYLINNMNGLEQRPDAGAVVENTVFVRLNELLEKPVGLHYWRTKAGAEVDFVIQNGVELLPIEVKYSAFDMPKVTRGYVSFIETFKPKRGLVLTKNYWGRTKKGTTEILFAPAYYL
jgi:predicted AAA+ superfamily ATPase